MSAFSFRGKTKDTESNSGKKSKKSAVQPGEPMVAKHPENQNIAKKLLRKLTHLYAHHRIALVFVTILLLGGGGYVVYRSFAAVSTTPTRQQVYEYIKSKREQYQGIILEQGTEQEGIRLPYVSEGDKYENYVILTNPKADLSGRVYPFKPDNSDKRCFRPFTKQGAIEKESEKLYASLAKSVTVPGNQPGSPYSYDQWSTIIKKAMSLIVTNDARGDGDYIDCNGGEYEIGVAAFKAAYGRVRTNLDFYGVPYDTPALGSSSPTFDISMACYSLYVKGPRLDACLNDPGVYLGAMSAKPATPVVAVFGTPALIFDNYRQQLVQIALGRGVSPGYLKALCETYIDPEGCKMFIDQSCDYFRFCGNPPPGPVATPVKSAPKPPPKDPRRGEDDGRWQQWPFNKNFYANPALPGRCIYKKANGTFAVGVNGADYDCNHLSQMYKCQAEMAKLNPKDPSSFTNANISSECGDQSKLRAAGRLVEWIVLNETPPRGNLEEKSADCTVQTGWAYSEINKSATLGVDLYYDGPAGVGEGYPIKADVQRDDLKGFGNNGIHGFSFNIPDKYKDNNFHTVYMYARGVQVNGWANNRNPLVGQKTFQCDYPPTGSLEKIDSKMVNDKFTCKAQGWAFDRSNPNQPLQVHAFIDGVPGRYTGSAVSMAAIYRDDLNNAGQGNGKHGFYFDIPERFRDANKHTLNVYAIGINTFWSPNGQNPLVGTMDFQCDQPPDGKLELATRRLKPTDALAVECVVGGWTADLSNAFYDNKVTLYFDLSADFKTYSSKVDSMPTGIDRPDVRAGGWGFGNAGNHGFLYQIPKQYRDNKNHTVHAYSMNTDINGVYIKQNNTFIGSKTFNCGT